MDKDTSQLNEDFIKNYNEESYEEYFFEADVQYLEKLHEFYNDLTIHTRKNENWKKSKSL